VKYHWIDPTYRPAPMTPIAAGAVQNPTIASAAQASVIREDQRMSGRVIGNPGASDPSPAGGVRNSAGTSAKPSSADARGKYMSTLAKVITRSTARLVGDAEPVRSRLTWPRSRKGSRMG
jgi:hypothetical protein